VRAQLVLKLAICVALVAITFAVFGKTLGYDFVNYDDNTYVYDNPQVFRGLTLSGVKWAFTHFDNDNWHPLTSISHMIDCSLFGLKPGGHHLVNVLLHAVAVVLLFLVLSRMTSGPSSPRRVFDRTASIWASAFVAALFAIHPLHVESVAWIAERKDVLSAVFFMLTLGAYAHYARQPSIARYIVMSIMFALGLMSKPMFVTVPLILLLLDYWPLNRIVDIRALRRSVIEKVPLLLLSAALSVATIFAQRQGEARLEELPFMWRITNALAACVVYIWQMIWPANLALVYPHPGRLPLWEIAGAAALLFAITIFVFVFRKRKPYFVTGWFWYLVMLLPVIGLIQVGGQAHADRYTYLPQLGLYLIAAWGIVDLSVLRRHHREILCAAAAVIIAAFAWRAWIQTSYWHDSEKLWRQTLALTNQNDIAHQGLGEFLLQHHRVDEAISEFRTVLSRHPNSPDANFQLASALIEKGEFESAVEYYRKVLAAGSDTTTAHCALGDALLQLGKLDDALNEYNRALKIDPANSRAETSLASALLEHKRGEEAIEHYRNVVRREPSSALAHYNLAVGLHRAGVLPEAIAHYKEALRLEPGYPDADRFLGQALLQNGQPDEAKLHLKKWF
jgi:tetratricopeptide (TPR) repeat protein